MEECGLTKRDFLRLLGVGSIGFGFGVSIFDGILQAGEGTQTDKGKSTRELLLLGTQNFKGFKFKEITPNKDFFTVQYSGEKPKIDLKKFQLRVEGFVDRPYSMDLEEIEKLPLKREFVTLECISNTVGGPLIGNALWEGVPLKDLLERAVPKKGAVDTVFHAEDGYSDSIPLGLSLNQDVFLALKMNGERLQREHGAPLRAVIPGIYGMKNVKWLSKVEVVNYDYKGFWQKMGWSDEAVIPLKSQIRQPEEDKKIPPGNYVIGGFAFGGRHGVSRVQVSINGAPWRDAELKRPLSRWAWSLWRYDWKPRKKTSYTISVRAFDLKGKLQESPPLEALDIYAEGSKGIHSFKVKAD